MARNIASRVILHQKKIQQAFTCQKSSKHQLSTLSSKSEGFGTPMPWMWVSPKSLMGFAVMLEKKQTIIFGPPKLHPFQPTYVFAFFFDCTQVTCD
jgi:hypothetical protein